MIRALTVLAAVAVCASPVLADGSGPVEAPVPRVAEVVPAWKLVKADAARDHWKAEAKRWKRMTLHSPSVQEALTIASIAYRIDRGDLSSTAWCESRHNPQATNGQYVGIMQLGTGFRSASRYFRAGLDPFSPYANILAAAEVIAVQGYRQWQCQPGGGLQW